MIKMSEMCKPLGKFERSFKNYSYYRAIKKRS